MTEGTSVDNKIGVVATIAADAVFAVKANSKTTVYKNVIIVGLALLLSYSSTSPTVSLVTSIAGRSLGNITFCLNYIFACLFTFVSIFVLDNETSKRKVIIIGLLCLVGFTLCNWYVSYYTLIPGTLLFGVGVSATWIASLMYTSKIAVNYAKSHNLNAKGVAGFFTGIIVALASVGHLLGSATTAGVLTLLKSNDNHYNDTLIIQNDNFTHSGEECHTNDDKLEFNFITVNTLRGLIVFYAILALITVMVFLDDIDNQTTQTVNTRPQLLSNFVKNQWQNIAAMGKLFVKKEMILSCALFFATGAGESFILTRFTKVNFIVCS